MRYLNNKLVCLVLACCMASWITFMVVAHERQPVSDSVIQHLVVYQLKDNNETNRKALLAIIRKYLTGHPGLKNIYFGPRGTEFNQPVNQKNWDVSVFMVFESKQAHDTYQTSERHLKAKAESKELVEKITVFDAQD